MGMEAHDMSLTQEDLKQIRRMMREELAGVQADNEKAHAAIGERINQLDKHLSGRIDSMAEDVAKIPLIEAEVRHINQRLGNLEQHLGV